MRHWFQRHHRPDWTIYMAGRDPLLLNHGGYLTLDGPVTIRFEAPGQLTLLPHDWDFSADVERRVRAEYGLPVT